MNRRTQARLLGLWCKLQAVRGTDAIGRAALAPFLRPPAKPETPKKTAFLDTARQTTRRLAGYDCAVYEWGEPGAPYVFSDIGWGYSAGRWRHFAPALVAAGYRFVAFDPPGHGRSPYAECPYPRRVAVQQALLAESGAPALVLAHSFGSGCVCESLAGLPVGDRPVRVALLAPFSEVRYIFRIYAEALGFGAVAWASLRRAIEELAGRRLAEMEPARVAPRLAGVPALIAHDPADAVTAFSNAERLARHWPGAYLYPAAGAGHGFRDAASTRVVLDWLLRGDIPAGASVNATPPEVLAQAPHALAEAFYPLELDLAHGGHRSRFFG